MGDQDNFREGAVVLIVIGLLTMVFLIEPSVQLDRLKGSNLCSGKGVFILIAIGLTIAYLAEPAVQLLRLLKGLFPSSSECIYEVMLWIGKFSAWLALETVKALRHCLSLSHAAWTHCRPHVVHFMREAFQHSLSLGLAALNCCVDVWGQIKREVLKASGAQSAKSGGRPVWKISARTGPKKPPKVEKSDVKKTEPKKPPAVEKLKVNSQQYQHAKQRFMEKWQPGNWSAQAQHVAPPKIRAIYKFNFERKDFEERQKAMWDRPRFGEYAGPGNCLERFHATRLLCKFNGILCHLAGCCCCSIVGDKGLKAGSGESSGTVTFGRGIYVSSMTHTVKGYGLAEGKQRPPQNLVDFVSPDAGNVVFIVDVLAGRVEKVKGQAFVAGSAAQVETELDLTKYDSRCIDKSTGNDELVIPRDDQVKLKYLIVFGEPEEVDAA